MRPVLVARARRQPVSVLREVGEGTEVGDGTEAGEGTEVDDGTEVGEVGEVTCQSKWVNGLISRGQYFYSGLMTSRAVLASLSARALASLLANWRGTTAAPAYTALADRIRLLIVDGRIPLGTRIPAERELATQLELSRTTVTSAFGLLRDAGYLHSLRGSGSVARLPQPALDAAEAGPADYLDFTKAAVPAAPGIATAAQEAAADLAGYLGGSGFEPVGVPVLREAIAQRYRLRGLPTQPEQIMVTIGAQHAIALLARTLLGRGDSALVESPSYPHAYDALRSTGARLLPVNVQADSGWDAAGLDQGLRRTCPALAYLMPDFHNPTGSTMPLELRQRMLALAAAEGTVVVADETMAELSHEGSNYSPLATLGAAVSVGSLGKTVWGGLRIGWIRAEASLIQRLVRTRPSGDLGTPVLEQLIAARLLGRYDEILADRRAQLRAGRDHLTTALRRRFPHWQVPDVAGGLTLWVNLGAAVSSQLTIAARSRGLLIAAGPRFGLDGAFERFLRIPFSYPQETTDRAVDMLASAWQSLSGAPAPEPAFLAEVV
jgi:DNA-binding transcriptional MocR family regulator